MVLGGLLLLVLAAACAGDEAEGESFRAYHLETAIGGPGEEGELRCGPPRPVCPGIVRQPPRRTVHYQVRAEPALTEEHIVRAGVRRATDPGTGAPIVVLPLTADGRRAYARLTREVARVGGRDQTWHHVALVVGDEIVAFAQVDFDQFPDGFEDAPAVQITAAGDTDARKLVERLRGD